MDHRILYPDLPPQHPLSDAIHRIVEAFLIAQKHANERAGRYTQLDMHLMMRLSDAMWIHYFQFAELRELMHAGYEKQPAPASEVVKDGRCVSSKPMK